MSAHILYFRAEGRKNNIHVNPCKLVLLHKFVLSLNIPVINFSVMSGRNKTKSFLGITSTFGE